jgi:CheY-like chemotaxis protein
MAKNLLLVEDNEIERLGLTNLLRNEGYTVTPVPNGQEALQSFQADKPDLILLDMLMGSIDGWHFLEERRRDPQLREVPVLIVTGLTIASEQWAQSLGASGLVKKPIDLSEMLEKIQQHDA